MKRFRRRDRVRDRGSVAIEYLGFLPILLIVGLAGIQLGLVAYAAQQAGTGARAAARAASVDDPDSVPKPGAAGRAAMSDWIVEHSTVTPVGEGSYSVTVRVPGLIPFLGPFRVTRTATMPVPDSASEEERP
ncbi:pilus assembly protein [Streptomyces sp. SKN60]|uniref:TadE family protein n=1 Tax=Streptomyces sp. SKN60 TaxID=2855506 RepID=UPI00224649C6|nr:TadE/TadG family type IV pilus assembly protein [Streptomyces sp. SKN60]MCX2185449.1 pilus assembly protein [Streptomyces sp. SKN60]